VQPVGGAGEPPPARRTEWGGGDGTGARDAVATRPAEDARDLAEAERLLGGAAAGAEAGIVVPWPRLARHRVHDRLRSSERYPWWVLWTVLAGLLSVNITFTVFVVALPEVARQLHTTVSTLTWTSTGPLLTFGVAAPVLGKLGDVGGYRRLYLWGLLGAAICVTLTATAPNAGVLIGARLLDGVEGAATGAASMALVLRVFSHEDRVKALGWWSLVGAGGPVIGVTVGAPVIQYFGWRALFWGELPLMAVAAVLAAVVLPDRAGLDEIAARVGFEAPGVGAGQGAIDGAAGGPAPVVDGPAPVVDGPAPVVDGPAPVVDGPAGAGGSPAVARDRSSLRSLDWAGSVILSLAVTAGLLALNQVPSWGVTAPGTLAAAAVCVVGLVAFVHHERRAPSPLVPLRYFGRRNFTFPLGAQAFNNFAYMGGFFLFPILMERVYGYSETRAGLVSTARPLLFSLVAPVAGYAAVVVGERLGIAVGAGVLCVSMVVFTRLGPHPSLVLILVALALSGIGIGTASPSTASSASNEVAADELGVMSAAQQLITQIGVVAGIQVMETVEASGHGTDGNLAAFHHAFAVGAVVAGIAVVCGLFTRDTPRSSRRRPGTEAPVA
jgi:MFS family permease